MSKPQDNNNSKEIKVDPYHIPDIVIAELQQKILAKLLEQGIPKITLDFIKEHTAVNHSTFQVTIFLKQFTGYSFTNNITIQFKKPDVDIDKLENKQQQQRINIKNNKIVEVDE